jgi:hypothetical protein
MLGVALAAVGVLSAVALAQANRSSTPAAVASTAKPTYYPDVAPIIQGRCVSCHRIGGIASSPLRTYAQVYARRAAVARAVRTRTMPPWHAERGHRAYRLDPSLSQAQITTVTRWVAQGAKRGNPKAKGRPLRPLAEGRMRVDSRLSIPAAFTPRFTARQRDDYRCFVMPWPQTSLKFITGFQVVPGQPGQVQRVSVYAVPPGFGGELGRWEQADPQPGYDCFGGPIPGDAPRSSLVAAQAATWTPSSPNSQLMRPGTGMPVAPGTTLVTEIHYKLARGRARADRTGVRFRLADTVPRPGIILGIYDPRWSGEPNVFSIPRGRRDVTYVAGFAAAPLFDYFQPGTVTVDMAYLNMHLLGTRGVVRVERANSTREVLLSVRRWDFDWQRFYWLARPASLQPGDGLSVECHYDNTGARDVGWGYRSTEETCMAGIYVAGRPKTSSSAPPRNLDGVLRTAGRR